MVESFRGESDRGAAVLAGSFVENYLATFIESFIEDKKIAKALFDPLGALSNFSQRIAVAYAFGFITKETYDDLTLIRNIRNHFAHHPFDTSFDTPEVAKMVSKLSRFETAKYSKPEDAKQHNRTAYLISCAIFCGKHMPTQANPAVTRL